MARNLKLKCILMVGAALGMGVMVGLRLAIIFQPPHSDTDHIAGIVDLMNCSERLKHYQIYTTLDTAYVYDDGKLIGATRWGPTWY